MKHVIGRSAADGEEVGATAVGKGGGGDDGMGSGSGTGGTGTGSTGGVVVSGSAGEEGSGAGVSGSVFFSFRNRLNRSTIHLAEDGWNFTVRFPPSLACDRIDDRHSLLGNTGLLSP
jgi:hypothetical protein